MLELVGTKSNSSTAASFVFVAAKTLRSGSPGSPLSTLMAVLQFGPTTLRTEPVLSTMPLLNPIMFELLEKVPAARLAPRYVTLLIVTPGPTRLWARD